MNPKTASHSTPVCMRFGGGHDIAPSLSTINISGFASESQQIRRSAPAMVMNEYLEESLANSELI